MDFWNLTIIGGDKTHWGQHEQVAGLQVGKRSSDNKFWRPKKGSFTVIGSLDSTGTKYQGWFYSFVPLNLNAPYLYDDLI